VSTRAGLDTVDRGKILLPPPGIEPRSPRRPVRSQIYSLSYHVYRSMCITYECASRTSKIHTYLLCACVRIMHVFSYLLLNTVCAYVLYMYMTEYYGRVFSIPAFYSGRPSLNTGAETGYPG
jgi:hypothetical protein